MSRPSLSLTTFAFAVVSSGSLAVPSSHADANAPVCAAWYGKADGLSCDFSNFEQCQATVQGLAGSCINNPRYVSRAGESQPNSQARRQAVGKRRAPP